MCFSYLIFQFLFLDLHYTEWCFFSIFQFTEAATGGVLQKKVFTKISQISQENTYFEEHLRTTASEFIGDTTFLHETILKKHTNGETNFQDGNKYNQKELFDW